MSANPFGFQAPMREVHLKRYLTHIRLGILEHERKHKQPVTVSVRVWIPYGKTHTLSIDDVYDYRKIVEAVEKAAAEEPIELQESFIQRIADLILEDTSVYAVTVKSCKTKAFKKARGISVKISCINPKATP